MQYRFLERWIYIYIRNVQTLKARYFFLFSKVQEDCIKMHWLLKLIIRWQRLKIMNVQYIALFNYCFYFSSHIFLISLELFLSMYTLCISINTNTNTILAQTQSHTHTQVMSVCKDICIDLWRCKDNEIFSGYFWKKYCNITSKKYIILNDRLYQFVFRNTGILKCLIATIKKYIVPIWAKSKHMGTIY